MPTVPMHCTLRSRHLAAAPQDCIMTLRDHRFFYAHAARAGWLLVSMAACLPIVPTQARPSMADSAAETQRSEAGVQATDEHWSLAELAGDTAWIDQMLLPDYRSVDDDGTVNSKAKILEGAARRSGTDLATAKSKLAAYRKDHPYGTSVALHDNTAVVTFYDLALGPHKGVKSADIFVYSDGHWHAVYSQHSGLDKS
jgi:hypothetical protein